MFQCLYVNHNESDTVLNIGDITTGADAPEVMLTGLKI